MHRLSRVLVASLVVLGVGGLVAGCTATPDANTGAAAIKNWDATAISETTQTAHLGGFSISTAARTVTAYRTASATPDDLARVAGVSLPEGYTLRVKRVHRSWTALERLEQTLPTRLPSDLRPLLSEVDIDTGANGLDVGITHVTDRSRAELRAVLGASLAKVFRSDRGIEV